MGSFKSRVRCFVCVSFEIATLMIETNVSGLAGCARSEAQSKMGMMPLLAVASWSSGVVQLKRNRTLLWCVSLA